MVLLEDSQQQQQTMNLITEVYWTHLQVETELYREKRNHAYI